MLSKRYGPTERYSSYVVPLVEDTTVRSADAGASTVNSIQIIFRFSTAERMDAMTGLRLHSCHLLPLLALGPAR